MYKPASSSSVELDGLTAQEKAFEAGLQCLLKPLVCFWYFFRRCFGVFACKAQLSCSAFVGEHDTSKRFFAGARGFAAKGQVSPSAGLTAYSNTGAMIQALIWVSRMISQIFLNDQTKQRFT